MFWRRDKKTPQYDEEKTTIGVVLREMGLINASQLVDALARQHETKDKLGDILVADGVLTKEALQDALDVQTKLRTGREVSAHLDITRCQIAARRTTTRRRLRALDLQLAEASE
jgi:hypothetical protein